MNEIEIYRKALGFIATMMPSWSGEKPPLTAELCLLAREALKQGRDAKQNGAYLLPDKICRDKAVDTAYADGWNDCIDEIEGAREALRLGSEALAQPAAPVPAVSLRTAEWLMNPVNGVKHQLPMGMQAELCAMLAASQPEVKS